LVFGYNAIVVWCSGIPTPPYHNRSILHLEREKFHVHYTSNTQESALRQS
jgi:hypothetical protein